MIWIRKHFRRYEERKPWNFCWRMGVESTVVSLVVGAVLVPSLQEPPRELLSYPMGVLFCLLVIAAPPIETLLLQAFPVFAVRTLRGAFRMQVVVATIVFALPHFPEGVATGVSAGIIGGVYFGFAYAHWRRVSRWKAFAVTTGCHAIHNGIAFLLLVILGNWA